MFQHTYKQGVKYKKIRDLLNILEHPVGLIQSEVIIGLITRH